MRLLKLSSVFILLFGVYMVSGNVIGRHIRFLQNADEKGPHFEADIILNISPIMRMAVFDDKWTNGVIPYVFSEGQHTAEEKEVILLAMSEISKWTCIKFVPRTAETDYLNILNEATGCWSSVGRIGGVQALNLESSGECVQKGIIMHELMHAIGFYHTHSDYKRDEYIQVLKENIDEIAISNFEAFTNNYVNDYGHGYDYGSIMQFGEMAFSKNGLPTILPLIPFEGLIGQRTELSEKDILKVNVMYSCPAPMTTPKPKFQFGKTPF